MFFVKNNNMNKFYKKKTIFLILLVFFILVILSIFIYSYIAKQKEEKLYSFSKKLDDKYQTLSLYSNNNVVNSSPTSSSHIIGKITIDKINLNYSILSTCSEELLKIAPCRLCGPEPNQIGNLCIAGHNYDNEKFFSNITKLSIGDIICIYDLNNEYVEYSIYDKFEVEINDTSVLNQDTNNKELTLITCNNKKKNRFILKAKEMD